MNIAFFSVLASSILPIMPPQSVDRQETPPQLRTVVVAQAATLPYALTNSVTGTPPPVAKTNVLATWPNDPRALYYELWGWADSVTCYLTEDDHIYDYCTYTNSITVPLSYAPWLTNYYELFDTNGTSIGWSSNVVSSYQFVVVSCGYWNYRHTNGNVTLSLTH